MFKKLLAPPLLCWQAMKFATGIFDSRDAAQNALLRLRDAGFGAEQVCMITPQNNRDNQATCAGATDGEQPGMGKVIGGVVGGAIGASGGLPLGMVISSALLPGAGPVLAVGFLTAALAGAAGAVGGATAGGALEDSLTEGLPRDELYFYEDALDQGRSVLIFRTEDDDQQERAKQIMLETGAESIDAARQKWWIGLRDAEALHYDPEEDFSRSEAIYRKGFEAAVEPVNRGKTYDAALKELQKRHPDMSAT
jgi:hypothetical protein